MQTIQSNDYFEAVKEYSTDNKEPARVYRFLLGTLRKDNSKLSDDLLYQSVDTLELQTIACASALVLSVFLCCAKHKTLGSY